MQGTVHLALGWLLGDGAGLETRRDRRIVGLAGLVPDIDVLVYPLAYLVFLGDMDKAFNVYAQVHHRYTHGVLFALLCAMSAWRLASEDKRMRVAALTLLAVFLHIVGDVIASGSNWPVYPLAPLSDLAWTVTWSWNASDWRNISLSVLAILMMLWYSRVKGYSMLECFSYRADDWMTKVMRREAKSSPQFRLVFYVVLLSVSALIVLPILLYMR